MDCYPNYYVSLSNLLGNNGRIRSIGSRISTGFIGKIKKERNLQSATMANLKGPNAKEKKKIMENFETAEQYSMMASAISGGVESPIQFVIQVISCIRNL